MHQHECSCSHLRVVWEPTELERSQMSPQMRERGCDRRVRSRPSCGLTGLSGSSSEGSRPPPVVSISSGGRTASAAGATPSSTSAAC
mmetsp:Transcript_4482/g.12931  ORF Transcript_4482/g.12931 Transcript_4482/m.12931 type:complete len:87 (-) Transcript_4482:49-309(-)